jgi:polar amino acid transport system substrate-binding protein
MGKRIWFTLAAVLLLACSAWARVIVVAQDAAWPPMESLGPNNEIVGFDTDFMTAVAREAGFDVEFKNVAWDRIFEGLESREYDAVCSSVSITPGRMNAMDFSVPYFWDRRVRQILVVKPDSPYKDTKKLKEVKGAVLGGLRGTTGYDLIEKTKGVTGKAYGDIESAMRDLVGGRLDGVVCDGPVAEEYTSVRKDFSGKLRIAGVLHSGDEYYGVAVRKGNKEVLQLINRGIEAVQAKGIDKELRVKWLGK